tara:strand:+ start:471 stop:578 length:108 start_codon:yes stop_codon:yes gene_type:complete
MVSMGQFEKLEMTGKATYSNQWLQNSNANEMRIAA